VVDTFLYFGGLGLNVSPCTNYPVGVHSFPQSLQEFARVVP